MAVKTKFPEPPEVTFPNFRRNFFAWSQKVLPTVFDDSLSYLERLDKIHWIINQLTNDTNELKKLLQEFADYYNVALEKIYEWFNNLDVYDEVYNILYEMVDKGILEDIINRLLFNYKNIASPYLTSSAHAKRDSDLVPYIMDMSLEGSRDPEEITLLYEAIDAHHIYSWYDELVEQKHQTRHSYIWGYLDDGTPLKWYYFEAETRYDVPISTTTGNHRLDDYFQQNGSRPLLMITSGQHGNEKVNIWALYQCMKDILDGRTDQDNYIRRNYDIVLMPACNPFGLQNNLRVNENAVDMNRNFSYRWDLDTSPDKGKAPFSEKSTQFVRDVREKYINKTWLKNGAIFIDSHDFDFRNYTNERLLWMGVGDRSLRLTLAKVGGYVKDTLTKMYPALITDPETQKFINIGATGAGYGSTCNAWNWNDRVKGFSLECPVHLAPLGLGDWRYSYESARVGWEVVRNFVVQAMFEHAGKVPRDILPGFYWALSTQNDPFIDTLRAIPEGKMLVVACFNDSDIFSSPFGQAMPINEATGTYYQGIFRAMKSPTLNSTTGICEYITTGFNSARHFIGGFDLSGGWRGWTEAGKRTDYNNYSDIGCSQTTSTITQIFQALPNARTARLYVLTSSAGVWSELPTSLSNGSGLLVISRNTDQLGYVEFTRYSNNAANRQKVISSFSSGALGAWNEIALTLIT